MLLALIGAQGVIGYAQYFSGLPAGLVWVHVSDSVLIWITAVRLPFALRDRGPAVTSGADIPAVAGRDGTQAGISGVTPKSPGEALSPDVPRR